MSQNTTTTSTSTADTDTDIQAWYQRHAFAWGALALAVLAMGLFTWWLHTPAGETTPPDAIPGDASSDAIDPTTTQGEPDATVPVVTPDVPDPVHERTSDACRNHRQCQDGLSCIEGRCVMATLALLQTDSDSDGVGDAEDMWPQDPARQEARQPVVMQSVSPPGEGGGEEPKAKETSVRESKEEDGMPLSRAQRFATEHRRVDSGQRSATCKKSILFVDYLSTDCD